MVDDPLFVRDLAYVIGAALVGGVLAWLARQPLILGYVVGGIIIGPFTPGPTVSDVHTFELFAEVAVVLLMFSIGIEFSLRDLLRVKWIAVVGGPLGIVLSIALSLVVGSALGWPGPQAIAVGAIVSVASTMVLARLLLDQQALDTPLGRVMIGITLVEDLVVVILTVVLPALSALTPDRLLALAFALGRAGVIMVPFVFLAAWAVPRLLTRVVATANDELFLLVTLAIGLGTAAVTHAAGLSFALGAFLAGLIVNSSAHAHQTLLRLLPIRDIFVALFFVTVGALIDPAALVSHWRLVTVLVAMIVIGKFVIWAPIVRAFRYPWATAVSVGIGLGQIGEFSFVLVQVARSAGQVGDDLYQATLAASVLTILINGIGVKISLRRLAWR
ncbi:MAG: hypothetical protein AUG14_04555 [Candidatus Rokubacteria bacterium 13_1_20CM_2_68_19]|nr:MAG: hypothetical protein AUG14_04555 [Candidatus Rokubacteria bacterium 13_1_20CM_2_68_19]PYN60905.1 MAG: hypothetical protein DMD90_25005 [Candidatus Rokubacteria bacterium]